MHKLHSSSYQVEQIVYPLSFHKQQLHPQAQHGPGRLIAGSPPALPAQLPVGLPLAEGCAAAATSAQHRPVAIEGPAAAEGAAAASVDAAAAGGTKAATRVGTGT